MLQVQPPEWDAMDTNDYAHFADFFANEKITLEKCLTPTGQCPRPAIRAHSIQNSRVISLLEEKGKVAMMKGHTNKKGQVYDSI